MRPSDTTKTINKGKAKKTQVYFVETMEVRLNCICSQLDYMYPNF